MRAKRFSSLSSSTIQRFPAIFGFHLCTKTLGTLAHNIRARCNVFFHGFGLLLAVSVGDYIDF